MSKNHFFIVQFISYRFSYYFRSSFFLFPVKLPVKISRKIRYRLVFKGVSVRNVLGFAYDGGGTVKIGDVGGRTKPLLSLILITSASALLTADRS